MQASTLQDILLREGQALVNVALDFQIENAGVKSIALQIPANAENVRFEGSLISDSVRGTSGTNGWANWEIKLQRRVIGAYSLSLSYQLTLASMGSGVQIEKYTNTPPAASSLVIQGIKVTSAQLQRSYLALRASGRLQVDVPQLPASFATHRVAIHSRHVATSPQSGRVKRRLQRRRDGVSTARRPFPARDRQSLARTSVAG